jgi:hypothetical protein
MGAGARRHSSALMGALETLTRIARMPAYRRREVEREVSAWIGQREAGRRR